MIECQGSRTKLREVQAVVELAVLHDGFSTTRFQLEARLQEHALRTDIRLVNICLDADESEITQQVIGRDAHGLGHDTLAPELLGQPVADAAYEPTLVLPGAQANLAREIEELKKAADAARQDAKQAGEAAAQLKGQLSEVQKGAKPATAKKAGEAKS